MTRTVTTLVEAADEVIQSEKVVAVVLFPPDAGDAQIESNVEEVPNDLTNETPVEPAGKFQVEEVQDQGANDVYNDGAVPGSASRGQKSKCIMQPRWRRSATFDYDECQQAFDKPKSTLAGATVLALPRNEGDFVLDCDASEIAIGAVLSQIQDGEERPICYASQLYIRREKNYNVTWKELLAVFTFVEKFRQYLLGRPFTIRTDHAALR